MSNRGRIIIISSPSGGGKGTVIDEMRKLRPSLAYSVSMTTRTPRPNEIEGVHYFFVTREEFKELDERGYFLESSPYSSMGNLYGTPLSYVESAVERGEDVVLEIEVNGMRQVKERMDNAVTFFILPPSRDEWEKQLNHRNDAISEEERHARMETGMQEINAAREYDYRVINHPGKPRQAAQEILDILDRKQ